MASCECARARARSVLTDGGGSVGRGVLCDQAAESDLPASPATRPPPAWLRSFALSLSARRRREMAAHGASRARPLAVLALVSRKASKELLLEHMHTVVWSRRSDRATRKVRAKKGWPTSSDSHCRARWAAVNPARGGSSRKGDSGRGANTLGRPRNIARLLCARGVTAGVDRLALLTDRERRRRLLCGKPN